MKFLDNFDINHVADEGDSKRDFGPVPAAITASSASAQKRL